MKSKEILALYLRQLEAIIYDTTNSDPSMQSE